MMNTSRAVHFLKKTPLNGLFFAIDNRRAIRQGRAAGTYAQHGEDRFVLDYFRNKPGIYVDVGANHPVKISNTYLLYRAGWSGLTVEPIERLARAHQKLRPRDRLEQVLVGPAGMTSFYQMHGTGHSTVVRERAKDALQHGAVDRVIQLPVVPLAELIDRHLSGKCIDFLTVDTEGFDLQVLQSGDWQRHRPKLVIYEAEEIETDSERAINEFMLAKNYGVLTRLGCNIVLESQSN